MHKREPASRRGSGQPEAASGSFNHPPREPGAESLDPETREVVRKFEELYKEPHAASGESSDAGDFLFDRTPDLSPAGGLSDARPRSDSPDGSPSRDVYAGGDERKHGVTAKPREPEVTIEAAMALFRETEQRGHAAARRTASARREERDPLPHSSTERDTSQVPVPPAPAAQGVEQRARRPVQARRAWPKVVAAAVVALSVGAAVGFFAGKTGGPSSETRISVSPDGGTHLRLERQLPSR